MNREQRLTAQNGWTKERMIAQVKEKIVFKSVGDEGNCMYRTIDDTRGQTCCAVGAFIPDSEYTRKMEGRGVTSLFENYPQIGKLMPLTEEGMVVLQHIHDSTSTDLVVNKLTAWIEANVADA